MNIALKTNTPDPISNYNFSAIVRAFSDDAYFKSLIQNEMKQFTNNSINYGMVAQSASLSETASHLMTYRYITGDRVIEADYTDIYYGEYELVDNSTLTINGTGRIVIL